MAYIEEKDSNSILNHRLFGILPKHRIYAEISLEVFCIEKGMQCWKLQHFSKQNGAPSYHYIFADLSTFQTTGKLEPHCGTGISQTTLRTDRTVSGNHRQSDI